MKILQITKATIIKNKQRLKKHLFIWSEYFLKIFEMSLNHLRWREIMYSDSSITISIPVIPVT